MECKCVQCVKWLDYNSVNLNFSTKSRFSLNAARRFWFLTLLRKTQRHGPLKSVWVATSTLTLGMRKTVRVADVVFAVDVEFALECDCGCARCTLGLFGGWFGATISAMRRGGGCCRWRSFALFIARRRSVAVFSRRWFAELVGGFSRRWFDECLPRLDLFRANKSNSANRVPRRVGGSGKRSLTAGLVEPVVTILTTADFSLGLTGESTSDRYKSLSASTTKMSWFSAANFALLPCGGVIWDAVKSRQWITRFSWVQL